MVVAFPSAPGARISSSSPGAHLRTSASGLIATVPKSAHSGHIQVLLSKGRHTSSYGPIYVYTHALHPPAPKDPPPLTGGATSSSAFDGQGMWIWYVSKSSGGSVASIVAQAHAAGVTTVFVKSSDGASNYWSQFSAQLVAELHANGLKVCAWQYVYGTNPAGEAALGAEAVADGADCLVIDAEAEYEGHYAAAQTYIADLRAKVGANYPVGLASFPYVSLHPSFPYSVFLGPNGAQYNAPQMYWKAIGTSVDTVYANTWIANRIYGRPIFPLGQTYEGVTRHRTAALPRGGLRLRSAGAVLLGLAGNAGEPVEHAGDPASAAHERAAEHDPARTEERQQRRSGAVAAGAPRHRRPLPGNHRQVRLRDAGQPDRLPDRPRHSPQRRHRRRNLGRAAGPAPRGSGLDGQRAERRLDVRRAESAWLCRDRHRSTSSRSRSPCPSARARAGAS